MASDSQSAARTPRFEGVETGQRTPARSDRAKHLALGSSKAVRAALERAGKFYQLAIDFERPAQRLSQWADPSELQRHPNTVDLAGGPSSAVVPIVRWIASHHDHDVLRRPRIVHADDHLSRFAALCATHNALLLALASYARGAGQASAVRELALAAAEAALETAAWAGGKEK